MSVRWVGLSAGRILLLVLAMEKSRLESIRYLHRCFNLINLDFVFGYLDWSISKKSS